MKHLFLFLFVSASMISLKAQTDQMDPGGTTTTTKSVYGELLGAGIGISANFDSRFSGESGFGFRVGLGVVPLTGATVVTVPLGLNYITPGYSSHFEAELTGTFFTVTNVKFNDKTVSPVFFYPHIGYRYTKASKSFLGRVYVGPLFFDGHTVPFLGISLGYTL